MLIFKGSRATIGQGTNAAIGAPPERPLPWQSSGAVDIEVLLIWAMRDQQAGRYLGAYGLLEAEARAGGYLFRQKSGCGAAQVEAIAAIGARIDVSAPDAGKMHPVAELVGLLLPAAARDALAELAADGAPPDQLDGIPASALIDWARAGTPPDWRAARGSFVPALGWVMKKGERTAVTDWTDTRPSALCCPIMATDRPAMAAVRHMAWVRLLAHLRAGLAPFPLGFALLGPPRPEQPWLMEPLDTPGVS